MRELERADRRARYPVALGDRPGGRVILAHCPDDAGLIEFEDAATGEPLTGGDRHPVDELCHAGLTFSPSGRFLLSAGWMPGPYGVCPVFDVTAALADPETLDGWGAEPVLRDGDDEVESVCWLDDDRLAVAIKRVRGRVLGVWSLGSRQWLSRVRCARPGRLLAHGDRVIALYGHPRLIDPASGRIVVRWPDVAGGGAAVAMADGRLAVAQSDHIAVIDLP